MENDRFYVANLTLENFRCFENGELRLFDPHFNLLVGNNGVGKSSVLLALANLFRPFAALGGSSLEERSLGVMDVRRNPHAFLTFAEAMQWRIAAQFTWRSDLLQIGEQFRLSPTKEAQLRIKRAANKDGDSDLANDEILRALGEGREVLALYGVDRQFKSVSEVNQWPKPTLAIERSRAYQDWQHAGVSADSLREWFRDQTLAALQSEQRAREDNLDVDAIRAGSQLTLVQEAVVACVEDAARIEYDARSRDIAIWFQKGEVEPFASLSDGQRALIGLVADIARRACLLNAQEFGAETLKKTTGLVLIDELDLHLHPKWQRQIIGALKRIFPKIQFFATTHSPQVIGEARPEEIVLLTPQGQKRPMGSYGMDSNWVLECVMEAEGRDPAVAKEIKRLYDDIEDGKFEEARARIANLRKEIGGFGDVEAAESYMWRVEREDDEAAE